MAKLGFLGAGNMGSAIMKGIASSGLDAEVYAYDKDAEKLAAVPAKPCKSETELVSVCKYVLLAVKPQVLGSVLDTIKPAVTADTVFISICAGISEQFIRSRTVPDAKVVLVGTLNPIKDATLNDEVSVRIGSLINFIMDSMNSFTRYCAIKYGYMYVDISDVDTPAAVTQMSIGHILSLTDPIEYALIAHPTAHGYEQIAERIIDTVQGELAKDNSQNQRFLVAIIDWIKYIFNRIFGIFGRIGK